MNRAMAIIGMLAMMLTLTAIASGNDRGRVYYSIQYEEGLLHGWTDSDGLIPTRVYEQSKQDPPTRAIRRINMTFEQYNELVTKRTADGIPNGAAK